MQVGNARSVRGVVTVAQTLATFDSVAGGTIRDGVTYVAGDRVLLVNQAAPAANGIYIVGAVAAGSAPLTRAPDFVTGAVSSGLIVSVSEGTVMASTDWKLTTTGAITVDTTSINFYPRTVTVQATLVAGTVTLATIPIFSATKSFVGITRITANTTASTITYWPQTITPGAVGTASLIVQAAVAAGTINNADISTLAVTVTNF